MPHDAFGSANSCTATLGALARSVALSPCPSALEAEIADDTIVCRCEAVTAGALREAARAFEVDEINRAKALTRCGMGRCQGRFCGPTAARVLARARGIDLEAAGRLRTQPPVEPLPAHARPVERASSA